MLPVETEVPAVQSSAVIQVPDRMLVCTEISFAICGAKIESSRSQTQGPLVFLAWVNCFSSAHLFILHFRANPIEN